MRCRCQTGVPGVSASSSAIRNGGSVCRAAASPRSAGLAGSFGVAAWSATHDGELDRAIEAALATPGPSLIEAKIDRANYGAVLRAVRG